MYDDVTLYFLIVGVWWGCIGGDSSARWASSQVARPVGPRSADRVRGVWIFDDGDDGDGIISLI